MVRVNKYKSIPRPETHCTFSLPDWFPEICDYTYFDNQEAGDISGHQRLLLNFLKSQLSKLSFGDIDARKNARHFFEDKFFDSYFSYYGIVTTLFKKKETQDYVFSKIEKLVQRILSGETSYYSGDYS